MPDMLKWIESWVRSLVGKRKLEFSSRTDIHGISPLKLRASKSNYYINASNLKVFKTREWPDKQTSGPMPSCWGNPKWS